MPKGKRKIISFNSKENNLFFQHRGEGLENIRAEEYRDFNDEVRDEKSFKSYIKKMKMSWADAYSIISDRLRTNRKEWVKRVVAKSVVDENELVRFLDSIKKYKTRKVFERTDPDNALKHLEVNTLYKAPDAYKTFERDILDIKEVLGIKKKYDGSYTKKTLEAARARLERRNKKLPK